MGGKVCPEISDTWEEGMNLFKYRIKTLFKYKDLVKELVGRDLKLKYRRSFLGYVWSVSPSII